MSYIIDKFNNGEMVENEEGAIGWLFDSGEFRPLMDDALQELMDADLITSELAIKTKIIRSVYEEDFLRQYVENQANRTPDQIAEERFEMRAAFGAGETVVNLITGEKTTL